MSKRHFYIFFLFLTSYLVAAPMVFSQIVITVGQVKITVPEPTALKLKEKALAADVRSGSPGRRSAPVERHPATRKATPISKKQPPARPGKDSKNPKAVSTDSAKAQEKSQPVVKADKVGLPKPNDQSEQAGGGRRKLSRDEVKKLAEELGLLEKPKVNPDLALNDDSISELVKQQSDETSLRLELGARKAVLDAADEQAVRISSEATLSHAVSQILLFYVPQQERPQQKTKEQETKGTSVSDLSGVICGEGDTSQELIAHAWAALKNNKGAEKEDEAKNLDKALACAKAVIDRWANKADEQEAGRLQSGECKTTPDAGERDAYFKSYWALSDVSAAWFIRGQVYSRQKNWSKARDAYKFIVNNYPCAYIWDPRGWFWKTSEGAEQELRTITQANRS